MDPEIILGPPGTGKTLLARAVAGHERRWFREAAADHVDDAALAALDEQGRDYVAAVERAAQVVQDEVDVRVRHLPAPDAHEHPFGAQHLLEAASDLARGGPEGLISFLKAAGPTSLDQPIGLAFD